MSNAETPEHAPEDLPSSGPALAPKHRQSLAKSRRELTEDEQSQPGVRLMLLDEVDRLDVEVAKLADYRDRYYALDKRVAVLEERRRRDIALDVVHAVCLSLGVGVLMLAPTLPSATLGWTAAAIGLILASCGVVAKVIQR